MLFTVFHVKGQILNVSDFSPFQDTFTSSSWHSFFAHVTRNMAAPLKWRVIIDIEKIIEFVVVALFDSFQPPSSCYSLARYWREKKANI